MKTFNLLSAGLTARSARMLLLLLLTRSVNTEAALVHHYSLDETNGTSFADLIVGGEPGALGPALGDTNWVPAKIKNGLLFAGGPGSYSSIPHSPAFDFLTGPATIMAWVNQTAETEGRILQNMNDGRRGFLFQIAAGSIVAQAFPSDWSPEHDVSAFSLSAPFPYLNEFHHVALSWDHTTAKIYIDGVEAASKAYINPGPLLVPGVDFSIGGEIGGPGRKFIGIMDEVRLYDTALSGSEIANIVQSGVQGRPFLAHLYPLDETSGTNFADLVLGGAPGRLGPALGDTNWVPAKVQNGLKFPGGPGAYAFIPHSPAFDFLTGPATVMAWVNPTADTDGRILQNMNDGRRGFLFLIASSTIVAQAFPLDWSPTHDVSSFSLSAPFPYLNEFHHVALSWDNATAKIYIDGAEAASAAYINPGPLLVPGVDFSIGGEIGGAGRKFIGIMDDVRLFNAALKAQDIAEIYRDTVGAIITITQDPQNASASVGGTATFTVVAQVTGTDPSNLRYRWQKNGVDIPGATSTSYATPALTIADDLNRYRCVVSVPGVTGMVSKEAVLEVIAPITSPANLIALWKFDETDPNTPARDSSGNGLNGVYQFGATLDQGKFGNAVRLDGTEDGYVEFPGNQKFTVPNLTLEFWMNVDEGEETFAIGAGRGGSIWIANLRPGLSPPPDSRRTLGWFLGGLSLEATNTIKPGTWQHLAVVQRGTSARIYIDGSLAATGKNPGLVRVPEPIRIGQRGEGVPGGDVTATFKGLVDEAAFFNTKLTQEQIQAHMNNGIQPGAGAPGLVGLWRFDEENTSAPAADSSGNGINGIYQGGVSLEPGKVGKAVRVDGVKGSQVLIPGHPLFDTNTMTIEFWLFIPADYQGPGMPITRTPEVSSNTPWVFQLGGGTPVSMRWIPDHGNKGFLNPGGLFLREQWYHVAVTQVGDAAELYVDGELIVAQPITPLPLFETILGGLTEILVGGRRTDGFLKGFIDDMALFDGPLTVEQIKQHIAQGAGPIEALPFLRTERAPNAIKILWPRAAAGFQLQETDRLSPANWVNVSSPVEQVGDQNSVTAATTSPQKFFRLNKP